MLIDNWILGVVERFWKKRKFLCHWLHKQSCLLNEMKHLILSFPKIKPLSRLTSTHEVIFECISVNLESSRMSEIEEKEKSASQFSCCKRTLLCVNSIQTNRNVNEATPSTQEQGTSNRGIMRAQDWDKNFWQNGISPWHLQRVHPCVQLPLSLTSFIISIFIAILLKMDWNFLIKCIAFCRRIFNDYLAIAIS